MNSTSTSLEATGAVPLELELGLAFLAQFIRSFDWHRWFSLSDGLEQILSLQWRQAVGAAGFRKKFSVGVMTNFFWYLLRCCCPGKGKTFRTLFSSATSCLVLKGTSFQFNTCRIPALGIRRSSFRFIPAEHSWSFVPGSEVDSQILLAVQWRYKQSLNCLTFSCKIRCQNTIF